MSRRVLIVTVLWLVFGPAMLSAQPPLSAPKWFPLPPEQDKHINEVLKYWEWQAAQIQRYRCQFARWEYEPSVLPRYPDIAATFSQGVIKFAAPDKGLFKVEKLYQVVIQEQGNITVPVMKDGEAQYSEPKDILGEHWVCDGKSTFQFDYLLKELKKRELPPEMQGKQIADGPLPFLFGAKAEIIKDRYWIRTVAPDPKKPKHYRLEAIPKRKTEAADYLAVFVDIDEKEFLPTALLLYELGGGRTNYEFTKREKNWSTLTEGINPFHKEFYAPATPAGWKRVNEPYRADPVPNGPVTKAPLIGPAPPPRQAQGQPRQTQGQPMGPMRR